MLHHPKRFHFSLQDAAPPWPENLWPYLVTAWLLLDVLLVIFRPSVTRSEFISLGLRADSGRQIGLRKSS